MTKGQAVQGAVRARSREAVGKQDAELPAEFGSAKEATAPASKAPGSTSRRRSQEERRSEAEARLLAAALDLLSRKGWV